MKLTLKILFLISVSFNVYLVWDAIQIHRLKVEEEIIEKALSDNILNTTWDVGFKSFVNKLKTTNKHLANKKYYYINVWTTWCIPCVNEMPLLDSLAGTLNNDVGYVFVSEQSDKVITDCLKQKKFGLKNFVFLNNMNELVSAFCNETKTRSKSYPMFFMIDNQGKILYAGLGAYTNVKEADEFVDLINELAN